MPATAGERVIQRACSAGAAASSDVHHLPYLPTVAHSMTRLARKATPGDRVLSPTRKANIRVDGCLLPHHTHATHRRYSPVLDTHPFACCAKQDDDLINSPISGLHCLGQLRAGRLNILNATPSANIAWRWRLRLRCGLTDVCCAAILPVNRLPGCLI